LIAEGEDETFEDVNVRRLANGYGGLIGDGEIEEGFATADELPVGGAVPVRTEEAFEVTGDDGDEGDDGGEQEGEDDLGSVRYLASTRSRAYPYSGNIRIARTVHRTCCFRTTYSHHYRRRRRRLSLKEPWN